MHSATHKTFYAKSTHTHTHTKNKHTQNWGKKVVIASSQSYRLLYGPPLPKSPPPLLLTASSNRLLCSSIRISLCCCFIAIYFKTKIQINTMLVDMQVKLSYFFRCQGQPVNTRSRFCFLKQIIHQFLWWCFFLFFLFP